MDRSTDTTPTTLPGIDHAQAEPQAVAGKYVCHPAANAQQACAAVHQLMISSAVTLWMIPK